MKKTFNKKKKKEVLVIAKTHQEADRFIQGQWIENDDQEIHRGCFFGCMTQTDESTLRVASEE